MNYSTSVEYLLFDSNKKDVLYSSDSLSMCIDYMHSYMDLLTQEQNKLDKSLLTRMKIQKVTIRIFSRDVTDEFFIDSENMLVKSKSGMFTEHSSFAINKLVQLKNKGLSNNVEKNKQKNKEKNKDDSFKNLLKQTLKNIDTINNGNEVETKQEENIDVETEDDDSEDDVETEDDVSEEYEEEDINNIISAVNKSTTTAKKDLEKYIEEYQDEEDKLVNEKYELSRKQAEYTRKKEKLKEQKKVFESERDYTYNIIKKDIQNGKIKENDIPVMFIDKYPVYEYMDNEDLLYDDDAFYTFQELMESMETKPNVDIDNSLPSDVYDHFTSSNVNENIKPLDDILQDLDNEEKDLDLEYEFEQPNDGKSDKENSYEKELKEDNK